MARIGTINAPKKSPRPWGRSKQARAVAASEAFGDTEFEAEVKSQKTDNPLSRLGFRSNRVFMEPAPINAAGLVVTDKQEKNFLNAKKDKRILETLRRGGKFQKPPQSIQEGDVVTTGEWAGDPEVLVHEFGHVGMAKLRKTLPLEGVVKKYSEQVSPAVLAVLKSVWGRNSSEEVLMDYMDKKKPGSNRSDSFTAVKPEYKQAVRVAATIVMHEAELAGIAEGRPTPARRMFGPPAP